MADPDVITVLSLCTGYGGLELGLARALANPLRVVAVEIEAYAMANLVAKAEAGQLAIEALWPDLKTFPAERFRGCFDFILAGYPCQPFSVAGKRQGTDDPRHLWPAIARIVKAVEPVWCFFENVPGHLSCGFPDVYRSLRAMGYAVEVGLFGTEELGYWHERQRLYILAYSHIISSCKQVSISKPEIQKVFKKEPPVVWLTSSRCIRNEPTKGYENKPLVDRRNNDGIACRVDRLRLLGNGVVPQQAEKAFREIYGKINNRQS